MQSEFQHPGYWSELLFFPLVQFVAERIMIVPKTSLSKQFQKKLGSKARPIQNFQNLKHIVKLCHSFVWRRWMTNHLKPWLETSGQLEAEFLVAGFFCCAAEAVLGEMRKAPYFLLARLRHKKFWTKSSKAGTALHRTSPKDKSEKYWKGWCRCRRSSCCTCGGAAKLPVASCRGGRRGWALVGRSVGWRMNMLGYVGMSYGLLRCFAAAQGFSLIAFISLLNYP